MKNSEPTFLVIGAGAIGGITAALLKENGYDVEVLCKYPEYASLISEQGITVSGFCGNHIVKVPSWPNASQLQGKKMSFFMPRKSRIWLPQRLKSCPF